MTWKREKKTKKKKRLDDTRVSSKYGVFYIYVNKICIWKMSRYTFSVIHQRKTSRFALFNLYNTPIYTRLSLQNSLMYLNHYIFIHLSINSDISVKLVFLYEIMMSKIRIIEPTILSNIINYKNNINSTIDWRVTQVLWIINIYLLLKVV